MSVYVRGMQMPKGCFFCPFNTHLDPDRDKCVLTEEVFDSTFRVVEQRRVDCPLVEVTPPIRLIDIMEPLQVKVMRSYGDVSFDLIAPTVIIDEEDNVHPAISEEGGGGNE